MTPTFIKSYRAGSDAAPYTIAKITGALACALAGAATDKLIGTFDAMGAVSGEMADVHKAGISEVRIGGNVVAGDPLTSNADGHAIAVPAGSTARIIGHAEANGSSGDVIEYFAAPGWATVPA